MPLADIFVSNDDRLKSITVDTQPSRDLGGVDVKSIDVVKLGKLYAMLTANTFAAVLPEFLPEIALSDDGPWIYRVPPRFRIMLAALCEPEIEAVGSNWAAIPEFGLDQINATRVMAILDDLVTLAQYAESSGKQLYLWNCL